MFKRSHVTNGGKLGVRSYSANPFFRSLIEATGKEPEWNFNKYLISKNGKVKHFNQSVEPDGSELIKSIKELL
jgi:glutathione peroxidase